MDYVFIDSNIWLSLYHFSRDDLRQFGRLKTLVGTETKLIIPSQLCDELIRNRETKLKESMKDFDVKKAKELLRFSTNTIETIGSECGYDDKNYFSRVFKKVEGCSSSEFRNRWMSNSLKFNEV